MDKINEAVKSMQRGAFKETLSRIVGLKFDFSKYGIDKLKDKEEIVNNLLDRLDTRKEIEKWLKEEMKCNPEEIQEYSKRLSLSWRD